MVDWFTLIVSILIGIGAIWVTIHLDRKRHPKREFVYSVQTAPLVYPGANGLDGLTISYHGCPVRQPYLATFEINSSGRAAIVTSNFDDGKSIRIDLQVQILAEIYQIANLDTVDAKLEIAGETVIELPPSMLPKGYSLRATYICDGEPNPKYKIPLPDIENRNTSLTVEPERSRILPIAVCGAAGLVVSAATVYGSSLLGP